MARLGPAFICECNSDQNKRGAVGSEEIAHPSADTFVFKGSIPNLGIPEMQGPAFMC